MMSSAYVTSLVPGGGWGMSAVYMLKRVGDRTPPCGTPVFVFLCLDVCPLKVVYCFLPFM